jgi:hypothetical protein
MPRDYYDVLGVSRSADKKAIEKACATLLPPHPMPNSPLLRVVVRLIVYERACSCAILQLQKGRPQVAP